MYACGVCMTFYVWVYVHLDIKETDLNQIKFEYKELIIKNNLKLKSHDSNQNFKK